jgi:hypothetical protein
VGTRYVDTLVGLVLVLGCSWNEEQMPSVINLGIYPRACQFSKYSKNWLWYITVVPMNIEV